MGFHTDPESKTAQLIEWLRSYADERIDSATIDERRCFPPYLVLDLGNRGLLGMLAERQYGGLAYGHNEASAIFEQLGAIDTTVCLFVILNNYLGIRPIACHAHADVRDELLPRLATGRELAAFALTEPGAGSNPRAMESRAETVAPDQWQLFGVKQWIGSAQWAGVLNVFVREGTTHAVGGHIVRAGARGLRMGPEAPTMGLRGMIQNTVLLEGVRTFRRDRLGQEGQGMNVAQDAMSYTRLAIGAMCIGAIRRCAQLALRYTERRQISTGPLLENPTTLMKLSRMTAAARALDHLVYRLAQAADMGEEVPIEGLAACKVTAPEFLWNAVDDVMQLMGGRGYMESSPIPRIMRDARVFRIFEGPTETMEAFLGARLMGSSSSLARLIGETLGAPALLPRLDELAQAVQEESERHQGPLASGSIHWGQARAGRLASWLVLQAAIEGDTRRNRHVESQRAASWVRAHLAQELRDLRRGTPDDAGYLGASDAQELIQSYEQQIGNTSQTLPPMANTLDPLLVREERARPQPTVQPETADAAPVSSRPRQLEAEKRVEPSAPRDITAWIVTWLSERLRLPASDVDVSRSFADLGLDSVLAVELTLELSHLLGVQLDETLLWEVPTIEALVVSLARLSRREIRLAPTPVGHSPSPPGSYEDELSKLEAELAIRRGR